MIIYLPKQRCASPHTIKADRYALNQLLEYAMDALGTPLQKLTFEDLDQDMVTAYLDDLTQKRHVSPGTRNQRLSCIRAFFSYSAKRKPELITCKQALDNISLQKDVTKLVVEYLDESALQAIFRAADTNKPKDIRNLFFMILLYDTGARVSEILSLKICDIKDGNTPTATLTGKGSKVRIVPLMRKTMDHFSVYMLRFHAGESMLSRKPLFYVITHGVPHPMSDDNVNRFINVYADKARRDNPEIPEHIHAHVFRHSRAMHLYQHGMDLTMISQLLGHADLSSTLIYAHADTEQKRAAIEAAGKNSTLTTPDYTDRYQIDDEETIKKLCGLK